MRKRNRMAVIAAAVLCLIACAGYAISSYQYYRQISNVILGTEEYHCNDARVYVEGLKGMHPNALSQWFFKKKVAKMVENNAPHEEMHNIIEAVYWWGYFSISGEPCGVDMWTKDHDKQVLMQLIDLDTKYCIEKKIS